MAVGIGLIELIIIAGVVGAVIFFVAKSMGGNEKND